MTVNSKRSFLRGAGLFGLFAGIGGAAVAESLPAPLPEVKEDISHLAPTTNKHGVLTLNASYTDEQPAQVTNGYMIWSPPKTTHSVEMSVGKDNRLWLKVGDEWHRVALES
jgi:hypothetical protein